MKAMNFLKTVVLMSVMGLLTACGNPTKKSNVNESIRESDSVNPEYSERIEKSQDSGYLKIVGDSVEIPFFEIELKLSEKAEKKLKNDHESVIVRACVSFIPLNNETVPDQFEDKFDFFEELLLSSSQIELTDKRVARFEHIKFSKDLYDLLKDNDIAVLINVFSGRRSSENNILDCNILEDAISNIKEKRFIITGKLIYNDD